jgi:glucose-6-phosphate dehydrogenase assembly protein OpcA
MIGSGSQAVACDQITIEVSASQLHRVPFILLPHIVPDLPVYLMWGQDPTVENEILPRLEQFATRVVFDPGCTTSISHFGSEILRQIEMTGPEILDLTWARVSAWRELIAGMYNSVEDLERLRRSTHIDVIYAHHGCDERLSCSLQALYLQAWLAARLGWSYVSREEPKGRLLIHYQGVTVSLHGMERCDLPLGSLLRIDIHSEDGYHTQLERKKETRQVVIQRSSPALCELPYSVYLSLLTRQHSLLSEIFYQPVGKHYPEMLQTLTKVWQV